MANVFLSIPVPASTGSGAPVNIAALGFTKLFSLAESSTPRSTSRRRTTVRRGCPSRP